MIITKIIPVKNLSDLKATYQYIINSAKTALRDIDFRNKLQMLGPTRVTEDGLPVGDYTRTLSWDKESNTVVPTYISTHLCQPDSVIEDFIAVAACSSRTKGARPTQPLAYEFVQSFEDDPELTDEMVHQIGLQLGESMFNEYPYVMASHVNPVEDEEGVRGKYRHNHFLISAYRAPEFCMEEGPVKLNKNHDLEDRLREMNDCLAIDHDLTIVRNPDLHRSNSWYLQKLTEKGLSWVEKTREIVLSVRDQTSTYEEFLSKLAEHGYTTRENGHLVYITPDGHEIRAEHLGLNYTKEVLTLHWHFVDQLQDLMEDMLRARPPEPLRDLMDLYGPLFVDIPVGIYKSGKQKCHPMSLQKTHHRKETLARYFDPLQWYAIKDQRGTVVTQMTGHYILDYMEALRRDELPVWATKAQPSKKALQIDDDYWYVGPGFQHDITAEHYRVCNYNADGTRRSRLEVALRYQIIKKLGDHVFRRTLEPPPKPQYMLCTLSTIQPKLDALEILRQENVTSDVELMRLCNAAEDRLSKINQLLSPEYAFAVSPEKRKDYLAQKEGLERRIERLTYAINGLRMTPEELAATYEPQTIAVPVPEEPEPNPLIITALALQQRIRWASEKRLQHNRTHKKEDHRDR